MRATVRRISVVDDAKAAVRVDRKIAFAAARRNPHRSSVRSPCFPNETKVKRNFQEISEALSQ
jgi:hypothetical protein